LKTLYYIQFTYTITGLGNKLITYINPAPEVILYLVSQLVVDNPLVKSYYCTKALVATL